MVTMFKKRRIMLLLLSLLFLIFIASCGSENKDVEAGNLEEDSNGNSDATDFPDKPIQMIVSYSAGAATDTQARILTQYAEEEFGQSIAVINMEGAGGSVGWNHFSQVDPDGYTIAAYNLPHIASKPLVEQTEYTSETFEPIANWGYDPTVFAVLADSPFHTLEDVIEASKENPNSVSVGNAGLYVGQHLATLLLEDEAGVELQSIAYDGASDAQSSLLGGEIDIQAGNLSDIYRLGDEVRILAVAAEERHDYIPDVPTFKEQGYDVVMSTDRGVAAVDGTPPEVVDVLTEKFLEIMNREDFQEDMEAAGADLMIMGGDELEQEFETRSEFIEDLLTRLGHTK